MFVKHRYASYAYQLPFGRGKTFGNDVNRWVDAFVWRVAGQWIWRFDDGFLLQLSLNEGRALPTYGAQRTPSKNNNSNWNTQVESGQFGVISNQANTPRSVQLALKLYFKLQRLVLSPR